MRDAYAGRELTRTDADVPLRARLGRLGVRFVCESVLAAWRGDAANAAAAQGALLDRARRNSLASLGRLDGAADAATASLHVAGGNQY